MAETILTPGRERAVALNSAATSGEQGPERPAFVRRRRIALVLFVVLVFVGLAPLATVAWKLIDINREALTTAQQEYQLLLASSIAREVDIQVEELRLRLQSTAQRLGAGVRALGADRELEIRRELRDGANERMLYMRYSYFRTRELQSVSAGTLPRNLEPVFVAELERAAKTLDPTMGHRNSGASLSDPIVLDSVQSGVVLVISTPVVSGGKFRGVLSALVDLRGVWHSVTDHYRTGHVVYGVDESGRIFASTRPLDAVPGLDVSQSALARRFLSGEGRARETVPYVERREGTEEHYLGSYETTSQGWGIFVRARLDDVYLPVQIMIRSTATWSSAALALAALAALFFARTLSNPINRLADASRAFARGEFAQRVVVRSRDEIGELAYTFNMMAAEIEDQIRKLRQAAQENSDLFMGTIRALAEAIDAKDPYTRGHSMRVNRYSMIIARELGLSEGQIQDIHVSSLLHDVGKIGISEAVLNKPGKLTEEEFEIMKTHPVLGANIMSPIRQMKNIIPGLRWHHERWAGNGYPDGLEGEDIPLMARVIAVADTFDAITTLRPYQKAITFDDAHRRVNELKGGNLDRRIVEAFNRAYARGEFRPEAEPEVAPAEPAEPVPG